MPAKREPTQQELYAGRAAWVRGEIARIQKMADAPDGVGFDYADERAMLNLAAGLLRLAGSTYSDGLDRGALVLLERETRDDLKYARANDALRSEQRDRRAQQARDNFEQARKRKEAAS